jgi:hypothetical protein
VETARTATSDASDVFVSRIATGGFGILGTILAMNVSKIESPRDRQQADQRVQRAAVRHLPARDVQPQGDEIRRRSSRV